MKRKLVVLFIFILFFMSLSAKDKIMLSLGGSMMFPNDGNFKDVYGKSIFYPELKLSYKVVSDFYIWAGFGLVLTSGETMELELDAESSQSFISLGGGYSGKISEKLTYLLELGLLYVSYKEEALELEVSDSALGFRLDGSLIYYLGRDFFVGICMGYQTASDTVEEISIKLGGIKTGLCLGVRF